MNNVMITGSTGFIGSHITRIFCANQIDVGCLIRNNSNTSNIQGLPVKIRIGDIRNETDLTEAFQGYDCVIHNAAKASDWGNYDEFYHTNVIGTLNVLRACLNLGIVNVILASSNSVYGEENCLVEKNENTPYLSHYNYFADGVFPSKLNYYRDTKALAKQEAIRFAEKNKLNLIIIEPVWVYGEREFNTGFYEYLKTASSGIPFLPGSNKNKFHVIYAEDLANAYLAAYKKKLKGINSFIIGNQKSEYMNKIYELFCFEAGIKKPANIPKTLIYPVAFFMELLYTVCHSKKPPLLTRGRVNMFYDNIEYSVKKAEKILGYKNAYSLEEGIKKTVAWYREKRLI